MKIVIDSDIPYVAGLFEPFADVSYVKGRDIVASSVVDADAIIVRTRTRCDAALLGGSAVKIVATATIGVDHIDDLWCSSAGIAVASAAGCNARAVAQWVFAALRFVGVDSGTIGIVGVGNVGSEVRNMALERGFEVILCDPPLADIQKLRRGSEPADPPRAAKGEKGFVELEELLKIADVVTLHVPLLSTTRDMVNTQFLSAMKGGALLLNSSRGEVVDEHSLLTSGIRFGIDVWRNEPDINIELLKKAALATPHIAGYSARGKARGSQAAVRAVAKALGIEELQNIVLDADFELETPETFDIARFDAALRSMPADFEALRTIRD